MSGDGLDDSDPRVRLAAINGLDGKKQQGPLIRAARKDPDAGVRAAAVARVRDVGILAEIAIADADAAVRRAAASRVKNADQLEQLFWKSPDPDVRAQAFTKISPDMSKVAREHPDVGVRLQAIAKADRATAEQVATSDAPEPLRRRAAERAASLGAEDAARAAEQAAAEAARKVREAAYAATAAQRAADDAARRARLIRPSDEQVAANIRLFETNPVEPGPTEFGNAKAGRPTHVATTRDRMLLDLATTFTWWRADHERAPIDEFPRYREARMYGAILYEERGADGLEWALEKLRKLEDHPVAARIIAALWHA